MIKPAIGRNIPSEMQTAADDANKLRESFGGAILETVEFRGEHTVVVCLEALHDVLSKCRHDFAYEMILDISSIDHFGDDPRFEMVYELASLDDSKHLRVRAKVAEDVEVRSATDLWVGADWHEREVWDMMGIRFDGHPDLRRILTDYGFVGHPFRKDFPLVGNVEVRYDEERGRVVYQPVSIEPRVGVPRVIREDSRWQQAQTEQSQVKP